VAKKFREVRKALRAAGWSKVRQAGSHETWESPDGERAVTVAGKNLDTFLRVRSLPFGVRQGSRICDEGLSRHL
jgi:predicted RNA binding protein YcfA (HicA-like mRNA interferase family)